MTDSSHRSAGEEYKQGDHDDESSSKKPKRGLIRQAFSAIWQFAKFMFTLPVALVRGRRGTADEVTVYAAHPSFFLWLPILVGFVSSAVVSKWPNLAGFFGWVYVWMMLYFI